MAHVLNDIVNTTLEELNQTKVVPEIIIKSTLVERVILKNPKAGSYL